jgi:hypothetical protein
VGALGYRCWVYAAGEGDMNKINIASYVVAMATAVAILVITGNLWYTVVVVAYGVVMSLFGYAEGILYAAK